MAMIRKTSAEKNGAGNILIIKSVAGFNNHKSLRKASS